MRLPEKEFRALTTGAGLIVLGLIERLPRQGAVLECTRSFDVVNSNAFEVVIQTVWLRASGQPAAGRPPYRYELARPLTAGERVTLLDDRMFRECAGQLQASGAVRPFERRLSRNEMDMDRPPTVALRARVDGQVVNVFLPVLHLGSDALGRLFHVSTLA